MPTSAPGRDSCGTNRVAWLRGSHPKSHEGIVDRTICFQWSQGDCENQIRTKIRTCDDASTGGTFYVYYLDFPSDLTCNYGFCAL